MNENDRKFILLMQRELDELVAEDDVESAVQQRLLLSRVPPVPYEQTPEYLLEKAALDAELAVARQRRHDAAQVEQHRRIAMGGGRREVGKFAPELLDLYAEIEYLTPVTTPPPQRADGSREELPEAQSVSILGKKQRYRHSKTEGENLASLRGAIEKGQHRRGALEAMREELKRQSESLAHRASRHARDLEAARAAAAAADAYERAYEAMRARLRRDVLVDTFGRDAVDGPPPKPIRAKQADLFQEFDYANDADFGSLSDPSKSLDDLLAEFREQPQIWCFFQNRCKSAFATADDDEDVEVEAHKPRTVPSGVCTSTQRASDECELESEKVERAVDYEHIDSILAREIACPVVDVSDALMRQMQPVRELLTSNQEVLRALEEEQRRAEEQAHVKEEAARRMEERRRRRESTMSVDSSAPNLSGTQQLSRSSRDNSPLVSPSNDRNKRTHTAGPIQFADPTIASVQCVALTEEEARQLMAANGIQAAPVTEESERMTASTVQSSSVIAQHSSLLAASLFKGDDPNNKLAGRTEDKGGPQRSRRISFSKADSPEESRVRGGDEGTMQREASKVSMFRSLTRRNLSKILKNRTLMGEDDSPEVSTAGGGQGRGSFLIDPSAAHSHRHLHAGDDNSATTMESPFAEEGGQQWSVGDNSPMLQHTIEPVAVPAAVRDWLVSGNERSTMQSSTRSGSSCGSIDDQ